MTYNENRIGKARAQRDRFVQLYMKGTIDADRLRVFAFSGPLPGPEFLKRPSWEQENFWKQRIRDNLGPYVETANRDVKWQEFMDDLYARIRFVSDKIDWAKEGF